METQKTIRVSTVKPVPDSAAAVKSRIVEAAQRVFFPSGFHRVSMDDLAREAGMSKKTLYVHFSSKEELLQAVLAQRVAAVEAELRPLIAARDPFPKKLQRLTHFLHEKMSGISPRFLDDIRRHAPECFRIVEEFRGRAVPLYFGRLFDEGVKGGYLEAGLPRELLIRVLLASIQGVVRPEVMNELRMHPAAGLDHILSIVLRGVLTPAGRKALRSL
jgi:AcrR family transcriptional regulator